jgi:hypothetical protein
MAKAPTKSVAQPTPLPLADLEPTPAVPASSDAVQAQPAAPQTAEIVQARTRYGFPVYVPTQKKLLAPAEIYPLILDSWVRNQLEQERGALVRVKL